MTQVIWAGPYVVKWRGAELPLNDVRISAVPFNRIWTGRQRPLDQTRMARYVTFDMQKAGSLVVALPEKADGVEVFPLSLRARVTVTNGLVRVALDRPRHFVLDFGPRAEPLHVFANPPSGPCPRNDWGVSFKLWGGKFSGVHENIVFRRNVLARVAARAFAIRSHLGCPSWTARNVRIEDIEIDTTDADPVPRLQMSDGDAYAGGTRDTLSLYELELGWPMADTGNQGRRRMTEEESARTSKTIEDVAFRRISVKGSPVRLTATRRTCGPNQTIRNVVFDDLPHVEETAVEFGK